MRVRGVIAAALLGLATGAPAQQAGTLADIRQDLSVLYTEVQRLRTELSTTGGSGVEVSGTTLDRINAIEAELQRVTAKTEELQFRIDQVVQDGTNRIGDLEFRLCELEPSCDIGQLGDTPQLGGGAAPAAPVAAAPEPQDGPQMAAGEEADFRRAEEALANGDFQSAAQQFEAFRQTYPNGPLEARAIIGQGKALEGMGDTREAARAFLNAYSGYPEDTSAPEALFRLGRALAALGQTSEACVALSEVSLRYPQAEMALEAVSAARNMGCS